MANVPVEPRVAAQTQRDRPRLLRYAPGVLALALFLALALGRGVLGAAAVPVQGALALALLGSILAHPQVVARVRVTRTAVALVGILALALGLRVLGLRFGLPYFEHPDEWAVADEALRMLRTGDYTPFSYTYPTLYVYMQVGVATFHFLWGAGAGLYRTPADIDPVRFYVWARALTALLGTGAVALTFLVGRSLYGRTAGLLAAALIAVMPAVAGDAHYVTTDTPAMFFTLLAFLAIVRLGVAPEHDGGRETLRSTLALAFVAGFGVGIATATKWNAGALVIALLAAIVLAAYRRMSDARRSTFNLQPSTFNPQPSTLNLQPSTFNLQPSTLNLLLAALAGLLLGFTLGVPFWLRDLPRILTDLAGIIRHYRFDGHPGAESDQPALFYWWALTREGMLLAWACLGGVALAFLRRKSADILVLAVVVPAVLQLTGVKVVFFRNAMPLLPFLCILAAALVVAIVDWWTTAKRDTAVQSERREAPAPVAFVRRLTGNRTALLLAVAALLMAEPLAQAIHDETLRSRPTTRILAGEWLEARTTDGERVWLEDNTLILSPRLRAIGGEPAIRHELAWYREQGIRFVVVHLDRDTGVAALNAFGEPAARFLRSGERHGPELAIFDTGAPDAAIEPRTPSGATLGAGAVVLDGYRHPGRVQAGTTLSLALFWRATRPLPLDYTVYVHLVDAAGNKVAQRDVPPLEGRRPTSAWQPGDLVRDDQDLFVPETVAPGTYRLLAGMYDAATMTPINDAGPIDLGVVTVTR
ncbi:phospholipid carrier-dependent glycosyltransferase [Roseiflexus sp.]|uniref:phospholipid carrier-dependent glycosyltransferase n=1 Tax=Roseiflexus sp. TaxID=2562120 RepID=UPI0025E60A4C|nr:phospholipid carrier-dependent glycosyltransferase [Roseiflexus sp.]